MGRMALGYGSEWHLLRYLGRHRHVLNGAIEMVVGSQVIDWFDFRFNSVKAFCDEELAGLEFLEPAHRLLSEWRAWWPHSGNVQNWDAVGKVMVSGHEEWLLLEAKAHIMELESSCEAKEHGGLPAIRKALVETQKAMRISVSVEHWLSPYYQYANRLAVLHFLNAHGPPARLVHLYFCGDSHPTAMCPQSKEEWAPVLERVYRHLGLPGQAPLADRDHAVFMPVCVA